MTSAVGKWVHLSGACVRGMPALGYVGPQAVGCVGYSRLVPLATSNIHTGDLCCLPTPKMTVCCHSWAQPHPSTAPERADNSCMLQRATPEACSNCKPPSLSPSHTGDLTPLHQNSSSSMLLELSASHVGGLPHPIK